MRRKLSQLVFLAALLFCGAIVHAGTTLNWYARNSGVTKNLSGIAHGQDRYIATGYDGFGNVIIKSADGIGWSAVPAFTDASLRGVAYGNGMFVMIGSAGMWNSPDGSVWTPLNVDPFAPGGVRYINNRFFIVGGNSDIISSGDGVIWTSLLAEHYDAFCQDIAFGNGVYVAVGQENSGQALIIRSSNGGATWTNVNSSVSTTLKSIAFGNGIFVAVGGLGYLRGVIMTSPDGRNWTLQTETGEFKYNRVIYEGGLFALVADAGEIHLSPDGQNWTRQNSGTGQVFSDVCYAQDRFIAVGSKGVMVQSSPVNPSRSGSAFKDYDGDGRSDFAVFDPGAGAWYVLSADQAAVIAWQLPWGMPGAQPVSGDYDGDGRSDFAVFESNTACWFILSADQAAVIAWQLPWGMPGAWLNERAAQPTQSSSTPSF